jgi:hypothetical protein
MAVHHPHINEEGLSFITFTYHHRLPLIALSDGYKRNQNGALLAADTVALSCWGLPTNGQAAKREQFFYACCKELLWSKNASFNRQAAVAESSGALAAFFSW